VTSINRQVATTYIYRYTDRTDVTVFNLYICSFILRHAAPADPPVGPRVPHHRGLPLLTRRRHKSYHPYLEKNKQRVREDEARAAAEELQREQKRVDAVGPDYDELLGWGVADAEQESEARLDILRRRAGSPEEEGDLPSTSATRDRGETLLERHRKEKARQEKKERKQRERLDFDFPSETARRADRRAERDKDKGRGRGQERDEEGHGDGVGAGGNEVWESGGHLNFFADLERNVSEPSPLTVAPSTRN
jgi:hypothetical protein